MFGRKSYLSALATQKQLLLAESEINRACLLEDWATIADGVTQLADRAKSFEGMAASILPLVAGVAAFTAGPSTAVPAKPSWFQKAAKGVSLVSAIWMAIRPRRSPVTKK